MFGIRRAALCGRPAPVYGEIGAGDLGGILAAQEQCERSYLLDGNEFLGRLGRQQDVLNHLILAHVACLHRFRDLLLHQGRPDIAGG